MSGSAEPADEAALVADVAARLVDAVSAALGPWVEHAVALRAGDRASELGTAAASAGSRCRAELGGRLAALVALDFDDQTTTPLEVLRGAATYPAEVLDAAGILPPPRDPFDERAAPEDRYSVGPRTWSDLGPDVAEAGIAWGAAKAHTHLRRRAGRG